MGVVLVELQQVVDSQHDADDVHKYPEEINDVMSEGSLDKRTGRLPGSMIDIRCHGSAEKSGSQVDGDTCEPDQTNHQQSKQTKL